MGMIDVTPYQNNNRKSDQYGFWYFRTRLYPTIMDEELLNHIANDSKVERSKVPVVNNAVSKQIVELLCNGHQLRIPHIGTLKLSVSSTGTETAEEYHAGHCIKKVRIILTPDTEIKNELKKIKFRKVYKEKKETPTPPEP